MTTHVLTLTCPDRPGIVASMSQGLLELGANIIESAQFGDEATATFCMRTRFDAPLDEPDEVTAALRTRAGELQAAMTVRRPDRPMRALVLVSTYDHCLVDLLYRWHAGELPIEIPLVVSNHPHLSGLVDRSGVAFEHVPVTPETRATSEARLLDLVASHDVEVVVLARYMQVLSGELCRRLAGRAVNIHHSFLPGFKGARPYHQAWARGVKVIGATAHYATAELDEGPIIDQDVARVSHAHGPDELRVVGRDLERVVLARAVKAHAEGRVFLLGDRTVVLP
ncbi:formyltetrahydrofolate deformylase [Iamia sp.]|uniref:formyltetrahydrofolate deformylase n=1 Tax=Iamia sp. TaxID=2722710 RepID=UPI002BDE8AB1|nr:formyltetrahydrofolate deformylase [Iamia sp.]HXH58715.1 formyltetrahydrofolate deformylase [Iamia sp.]